MSAAPLSACPLLSLRCTLSPSVRCAGQPGTAPHAAPSREEADAELKGGELYDQVQRARREVRQPVSARENAAGSGQRAVVTEGEGQRSSSGRRPGAGLWAQEAEDAQPRCLAALVD